MNKETNKLLADFLGEKLTWNDLHDDWMLYEYDGKPILWKPDSDWNQLMPVIDKIKETSSEDDIIVYNISHLLDTPIGCSQQFIYRKVIKVVQLIINESSINPE